MLLENKKMEIGFYRSRLIKKHILNCKCESVFEIGIGFGLIGSYILKHNNKIKYTGVEIDKESFDKSQFLHLNTINADFSVMDKIEDTFYVLMLWEVIEQLQDLKIFIELAYKKLNKNGKIILSNPHYNKIYNYPKREKDQIFQDFSLVHINFFTLKKIINIFEINQYRNCKVLVKKFPYINFKSKEFYINFIKAFFNNYKGSTIYFVATK
jgi:2-polyprenyl-3-methyl-5-hydroxy-6-metoxy-1,4-benzoquinol methylase